MAIKTVSFTYGRKFNLGDYNSANIECTIWAELDEGQTEAEALAQCVTLAKQTVRENAEPLFAKQSAEVKALFAGLPLDVQEKIRGQLAETKGA